MGCPYIGHKPSFGFFLRHYVSFVSVPSSHCISFSLLGINALPCYIAPIIGCFWSGFKLIFRCLALALSYASWSGRFTHQVGRSSTSQLQVLFQSQILILPKIITFGSHFLQLKNWLDSLRSPKPQMINQSFRMISYIYLNSRDTLHICVNAHCVFCS